MEEENHLPVTKGICLFPGGYHESFFFVRKMFTTQSGPLPVVIMVVAPLIGVATLVTHLFAAIYRDPMSLHNDQPPTHQGHPLFARPICAESSRCKEQKKLDFLELPTALGESPSATGGFFSTRHVFTSLVIQKSFLPYCWWRNPEKPLAMYRTL